MALSVSIVSNFFTLMVARRVGRAIKDPSYFPICRLSDTCFHVFVSFHHIAEFERVTGAGAGTGIGRGTGSESERDKA